MVKNLLILNIGIFAITDFVAPELSDFFAVRYFGSDQFAPWQLFTYMFMHGSWSHLLSNMLGLFVFGPRLEMVLGAQRFLLFYLVCGLGAVLIHNGIMFIEIHQLEQVYNAYISDPTFENLLSFVRQFGEEYFSKPALENYEDNANPVLVQQTIGEVKELFNMRVNAPMVGASGSVFGILLAFGMVFPNLVLMLLIPPIPIKAKYLVLMYGLFEFFSGVQPIPGDNVAHFAHLGGMLFAFILIRYWGIQSRNY